MAGPVLIVGATGQVGSALREVYADCDVLAPAHGELAIEDTPSVRAYLDRHAPELVFNCTALHRLDECEAQPSRAFAVNAEAVGTLAKLTAERGAAFATFSSDYVFGGLDGRAYSETDLTGPLNAYGVSKLAGEHMALYANPRTTVFRISSVFGPSGFSNKGPTFVELMISKAESGQPISVVDNVFFSPSYTPDVAATFRRVLEAGITGLVHVTNEGVCSWYELAEAAIAAAGLRASIERTQYSNETSAIKRPLYSVLAHGVLRSRGIPSPRSWRAAVEEYAALRSERQARAR